MPGEYAFEIDSTVGRYWLANGAGFDVVVERGRRIGVIEEVVVDPFTQEVSGVVVRRPFSTGIRRPAHVETGELTAVLPASKRFLVIADTAALKQRRTADRVHASAAAVERYTRAHWPTVRHFAGATAARVGDVLTAVVTLSVAGSEWAWRTARERLREGGRRAHSRTGRAR
jgi:hypothetical protein